MQMLISNRGSISVLCLALGCTGVFGAPFRYEINSSSPESVYRCGDVAAITVKVAEEEGHPANSGMVRFALDDFGTNILARGEWDLSTNSVFGISGSLDKPGFLRIVLRAEGTPDKVWSVAFSPMLLKKGSPRPEDFDSFWADARKRLAQEVPLDPIMVRIPERSTAEFDFHRVSFATFGRRVYGYLSVPTDRTKAPYPVRIGVNAAGFGNWTNDMKGEKDEIRMQMSVYDFEPDWRWAEMGLRVKFDELQAKSQEKYGTPYSCAGLAAGREDYFFYHVVLGIDRAVDWLVAREDVDRTRVRYAGTSQGGGFGFYLCGLNKSFTRAAFFVPAMTDTMGYLQGRTSGWPHFDRRYTGDDLAAAERNAPYFDGANFASRITCPVRVAVGFADTVCPPCAVYAAYNEIRSADKTIRHCIGMGHGVRKEIQDGITGWLRSDRTDGPVMSAAEFFIEHLDTTIPELASIPEKVTSGDLVGAEKVFADYLRATLNPERYNRAWIGKAYPAEARDRLFRLAERTMSYHLDSASKNHHQYPIGSVDWKFNPTFNKQKEYVFVLSRHAFLTDLAEYYTLTGDERAANVYTNMISSWIDQAKAPPVGANQYKTDCWRTIECGIRMGAWSRQIHAFLRSPAVTDRFLTDFFISVWEHGRRLRERPTHGNWFLIEMTGLVRIGLTYPFLKDAKPWLEYAMGRLENEFTTQVYPDGFQYELSTNYHGTCLECFNAVREAFTDNGLEPPDFLAKGMRRMYEVYWKLSQPSRVTPDLNDGGRRDVAANCAAALRLYPDDPVFRWFATGGGEGVRPDVLSLAFPYAGAVVFRDSWSTNAVWGYLDASPFGRDHQHEDKLNFILSAYGKDMVVEPGNYFYDTSEMRKYVLSTFAHNTVLIDGKGQQSRKGYQWRDEDIRKKADLDFSTTRGRDFATSTFSAGYGENAEIHVHHARTVLFLKDVPGTTPFFVVIDRLKDLDGSTPRAYEQVWHLEDCNLQIEGRSFRADFGDGVGLYSVCSDEQSAIADCRGQKDPVWQGWMPIRRRGPHEHRPIPTPVIRGMFSGARRVVTVLYPYGDGSCPLIGVEASPDVRDGRFCILMADGRKLLFEENAKE